MPDFPLFLRDLQERAWNNREGRFRDGHAALRPVAIQDRQYADLKSRVIVEDRFIHDSPVLSVCVAAREPALNTRERLQLHANEIVRAEPRHSRLRCA